jgi:E3 ubiquitin-protein ligase RGLG
MIGVDFTASNEWKGRKSFNQSCLHKLVGTKVVNPYQKVMAVLGQTLAPFDDDNKIPAYGFGDSKTRDHDVFPFLEDEKPCNGFQEVGCDLLPL